MYTLANWLLSHSPFKAPWIWLWIKSECCHFVHLFVLGRERERERQKKESRGSERISGSHHKIAAFQASSKRREMTFNLKIVITLWQNCNWGNEAWNRGGKNNNKKHCTDRCSCSETHSELCLTTALNSTQGQMLNQLQLMTNAHSNKSARKTLKLHSKTD